MANELLFNVLVSFWCEGNVSALLFWLLILGELIIERREDNFKEVVKRPSSEKYYKVIF